MESLERNIQVPLVKTSFGKSESFEVL
jgi:hypothetical protein